jgi:glutathione synthase/RimK-type ligase-like ATP-grasp enzyme
LTPSSVLIVTNTQDVGADFLVRELGERDVSVVRLNAERAPRWELALWPTGEWRVGSDNREVRSGDCAGVWWRRPEPPELPAVPAAAVEAVRDQWRALVTALATVKGPIWVSLPAHIHAAESKALQLNRAHDLGFAVPDALWTNDLLEAQSFVERWDGKAVVKSVTSAWWEERGQGYFVYAGLVSQDSLPTAERLAAAPLCFQQPIISKRDVRVTVVDGIALAAIRDAGEDEPLDWRAAPERDWVPHVLPRAVADRCCMLVRDLGLRFGGIDLLLDAEGVHWFLELNPNGEWGWLQRSGLPIAEALADTLTSGVE